MDKPKLVNCTPQDVTKTLKKLGGFSLDEEASRHIGVKHIASGKKSTIPRTKPVNKHLLKDFVEDYLVKELGYSEEEIFKHLWC